MEPSSSFMSQNTQPSKPDAPQSLNTFSYKSNPSQQSQKPSTNNNTTPMTYKFGARTIPSTYVFIERRHIYAMVNPCGFSIGHVLICPIR